MTKQEMFDLAVRGLSRQSWRRSMSEYMGCSYSGHHDRRCAWGHVDTSLTDQTKGTVFGLHARGIGIAATLDIGHLSFAGAMQATHDECCSPELMLSQFILLAQSYGLAWPPDVPTSLD